MPYLPMSPLIGNNYSRLANNADRYVPTCDFLSLHERALGSLRVASPQGRFQKMKVSFIFLQGKLFWTHSLPRPLSVHFQSPIEFHSRSSSINRIVARCDAISSIAKIILAQASFSISIILFPPHFEDPILQNSRSKYGVHHRT